jgi:hypothetical protein
MIAKAIVRQPNKLYKTPLIIPVCLPAIEEVERFAKQLHAQGIEKTGEFAGWPYHYIPQSALPPVESALTFTPAVFMLGAAPIWAVSIDWENGDDQELSVTVLDNGIVKEQL